MHKTKLFIENFLIYGIGGIFSKAIPLIMVPIITRIMPNSEYYGLSDLVNTLVSIAGVLATMGIYDGLFRMYFEKDDKKFKTETCSTALLFGIVCSTVVCIVMLLFNKPISSLFFGGSEYNYLVLISAITVLVSSTNQIVAAPIRLENKKLVYLITNTIAPIVSYTIAIILLLKGLYVLALPLAALVSGFIIEVFYFIYNKKWFSLQFYNSSVLKQMLLISLPLVPNFLVYWIFNSCDKIMITNSLGLNEAGIYSIGAKLGHCSQLIYIAFAGGWSYFVFSTMHDHDQVNYNSKLFEIIALISVSCTALLCVVLKPLYSILFPSEYYCGYIIVPYLFMCPLMLILFQIATSQFAVIKKTWFGVISLSIGAIINVVLNWLLISLIGIEGAAVATFIGYFISLLISTLILRKMCLFCISKKLIVITLLYFIFIILWRFVFNNSFYLLCFSFLIMIFFDVLLYYKEFRIFWKRAKTIRK